jgi:hypothetical protein
MTTKVDELVLAVGTLVRHRVSAYVGRIDGITAIQSCFTSRGAPMPTTASKENFQYRVIVPGEKIRRIAPVRDLEVLAEGTKFEVICFGCRSTFSSNPTLIDKPAGLCECGGWICPDCLACQPSQEPSTASSPAICPNQRKRLLKKATRHKRAKSGQSSKPPIFEPAAPRFRN